MMEMYVLQVRPGYEESAAAAIIEKGFRAICPKAVMILRYGGEWHEREKLIFTQYIFVECELTDEVYYRIMSVFGVVRFLGSGKPEALPEHEQEYIKLLWNNGKPITASKVYTTASGDKMAMSGVLKKYRGDMVNLDLRQRRAKVKIDLCGKLHTITLPVIPI